MYIVAVDVDGTFQYVKPCEDGTFVLTRRNTVEMNLDMATLAEEWAVEQRLPAFIHRVS